MGSRVKERASEVAWEPSEGSRRAAKASPPAERRSAGDTAAVPAQVRYLRSWQSGLGRARPEPIHVGAGREAARAAAELSPGLERECPRVRETVESRPGGGLARAELHQEAEEARIPRARGR